MNWTNLISLGVIGIPATCYGIYVKWRYELYREYEEGISSRGVLPNEFIKGLSAKEETIEAEDRRDLLINYPEKTIKVKVESNSSIEDVKSKITSRFDIPKDQILLVFDGKQLANHDKISDYNCRGLLLMETKCFGNEQYDIICYDHYDNIIKSYKNYKQPWHSYMSIGDSTQADCISTLEGKVFLRKGDLIEFQNKLNCYSQWVIYVGNMQVVYVQPCKSNAVTIGNLQEVWKKRRWRVNNSLDEVVPVFDEDEIVRRAMEKLGEENPKFRSLNRLGTGNPLIHALIDHPWLNNSTYSYSECFCHWIRCNVPISSQMLIFDQLLKRLVGGSIIFSISSGIICGSSIPWSIAYSIISGLFLANFLMYKF
jgi:hypothetical protein